MISARQKRIANERQLAPIETNKGLIGFIFTPYLRVFAFIFG
jgi:hypothetical protein